MYAFYKSTIAATLAAASAALLTVAITAEPRSTPKSGENGSIVLPIKAAPILSQCGDYFTFNPDSNYFGVVPEEYDKDYVPIPPMIVPVYGFMVDDKFNLDEAATLPQGENPYDIGDINRALWEGHTFIWVSPDESNETYEYVKTYTDKWNETHKDKVIVLTWQEDRELPLGRKFAFSSWGISQSCMSFSDETFEQFMEQSTIHNAGRDTAAEPPTAKLIDGKLPKQEATTP